MKNKFPLWFWLFIALGVRVYKVSVTRCIAGDGVAYLKVARDWLQGAGIHPVWPPLYPWLVSLLWRMGIPSELSGQLVSVIFGVLLVALVYLAGRRIFPPPIAAIACIMAVFQPFLVRYSAEVLADSLYTFLLTAVIVCGWWAMNIQEKVPKDNRRIIVLAAVVTGIFTALAYLTKPEGVGVLLVISVWWLWGMKISFPGRPGRRKWLLRISMVLCAWAVFCLISSSYIYAVKKKTGQWMISQKQTIVFSVALQEKGYTDKFLNISPLAYAKAEPVRFFAKVGSDLLVLLGRMPDAWHPLLFILLIIGFIGGIREKRFLFYLLTIIIPFLIGYAVYHPGRRYLVNWAPLLLFFSAYGVWKINKRTRIPEWILMVVIVLIMLPQTLKPIRVSGIRWKQAGNWIKDNAGKGRIIMGDDERIAFYAEGRQLVPSPSPPGDEKTDDVDYIVTEEKLDSFTRISRVKDLNIYYAGD